MVSIASTPASIEGTEIRVIGQDIKPAGPPKKLIETDEIVFQLTAKRRGVATVIKENSPKKAKFKPYSMLDINSSISGKWLWGFSSNPISRGDIVIGGQGRTSSHPGQELMIYGTCFMEIIEGRIGLPLPKHPAQELLP